MPKAKPTQVIVHRIELQETERATLEAALAGRFVTNAVSGAGAVLSGIGAALAPFTGAISALAVLWIADRSLDEILDAARKSGEELKQRNEEAHEGYGAKAIEYVSALLTSTYDTAGWDGICLLIDEIKIDSMKMVTDKSKIHLLIWPPWFSAVVVKFLETICNPDNVMAKTKTPTELWAGWYSVDQYGKDAYYYETNGSTSAGVWSTWQKVPKGPLGKLWPF